MASAVTMSVMAMTVWPMWQSRPISNIYPVQMTNARLIFTKCAILTMPINRGLRNFSMAIRIQFSNRNSPTTHDICYRAVQTPMFACGPCKAHRWYANILVICIRFGMLTCIHSWIYLLPVRRIRPLVCGHSIVCFHCACSMDTVRMWIALCFTRMVPILPRVRLTRQ